MLGLRSTRATDPKDHTRMPLLVLSLSTQTPMIWPGHTLGAKARLKLSSYLRHLKGGRRDSCGEMQILVRW
jgi:hypothetical protein